MVTMSIPRRPEGMDELPLALIQQRYWLLCTGFEGEGSAIVFISNRLRGDLDVPAWTCAVATVVDRHEPLRTRFVVKDGTPIQMFDPPGQFATEFLDLSHLPEAEREQRAHDIVNGLTNVLLDMERDPLVTSVLLRMAPDDHIWCISIHHILADGISMFILAREVRAIYRALVEGTEPELPQLKVRFGDFAVWQNSGHGFDEDDMRYWLTHLADAETLRLPTDLPRPPEKTARAAEYSHAIRGGLADRLEQFGRAEGGTLFMVLVAAMQSLLGHLSNQDDVVMGTVATGRTLIELEPLVGLFANPMALRNDLSGDPTFRELMARTTGMTLDALDRQDVPFGRIVAELGRPPDRSRTDVFQIMFVLHNGGKPAGGRSLPSLVIELFQTLTPPILHDMVIDVSGIEDGLWIDYRFDSALFRLDTVTEMARRYEALLRAAVDHPDARISELNKMSELAGAG
jgi:hypothetical protein